MGQPVWQEVPGEFRNQLRRLVVTQGDTEPASVEQQRWLGSRCPSLYDLRNLFQVNGEEGGHLWAMVYLLHSSCGGDGREEAEELLARQSGNRDKPRILDAFNEPIENWLDFFMFTMFTDRDGKSQLLSLSESSLDPLSRTTRFMLTEEAHHMFVGETGIARILERTCQLMKEAGDSGDVPTVERTDLLRLPDRKFNRGIGMYSSIHFDPQGHRLSDEEWTRRKSEWLPAPKDREYLLSIQASPVYEPGKFANYIAPPQRGVKGQPVNFEYVRTEL